MRLVVAAALVLVASSLVMAQKVKLSVNVNERFSFAGPFTYAWTTPTGELKMLQVTDPNPDRWLTLWNPPIVSSIDRELRARQYTPAPLESADIKVTYYILIGPDVASQKMGQFMAPTMEWGLPPFSGLATSYDIAEKGSLVIDLYSQKDKVVVWRGMAQANIDLRRSDAERNAAISKAVGDLFKKHYPKIKK
ncbi:DUF4136 domain-containing protein [Luteitalea sp. TBR-22]|uniref:DUF4136 domain-containing protein n=1 Tax=Luteitalea sp. TBR-22 TaxID=2802971 RepID=UPI001EF66082|nr:DUF4136 domain-containing protein [Luteitalea sp. TBR-22]